MDAPSHPEGYRLLRLLSRGGMGEVYLARREGPAGFSKLMVVKRILRHLAGDASAVELFVREARVAALLSHPNLVQIFELGQQGDDYFIAMEYIRGRSVRAVLERLQARGQHAPPAVAAALATQALRGLHYAHSFCDEHGTPLGVVHRDVSPENLLVAFDGYVKLVDFGIAQAQLDASGHGPSGVRGKRAYMAPEQMRATPVDGRADLYALGAVLHELLTGSPPPQDAPDALDDAGVPGPLAAVVRTALAADPVQRFPSARAMLSALDAVRPADAPFSHEVLAVLMADLFGAEAAATEATKEVMPEQPLATLPLLVTVPLAGGSTRLLTAPLIEEGRAPAAEAPALPPPRGGKRVRLGVHAALALLGGGAVVVGISLPGVPSPGPRTPADTSTARPIGAAASHSTPVPLLPPERPVPASPSTPPGAPASGPDTAAKTPRRAEEEAAPPAARARPRTRIGRLSVRANPWAEVFLDGHPLGLTPLSDVPVLAGRHRLVMRHPELGAEHRRQVEVPAGEHVVVKEDLLIPVSP